MLTVTPRVLVPDGNRLAYLDRSIPKEHTPYSVIAAFLQLLPSLLAQRLCLTVSCSLPPSVLGVPCQGLGCCAIHRLHE